MADAAVAASSDCWPEGLQAGDEVQSVQGRPECEDVSSSHLSQIGPSSSAAAALSILKKVIHVLVNF